MVGAADVVTGVVTAVADSTLVAEVASTALAAVVVTVTGGCATAATTLTAATEVVGDAADAAVTEGACFEFGLGSTGLDASCSGSGAGVAGNSGWASTPLAFGADSVLVDVGAVDAADSVVLVCAPPLLLTVTPVPTSVLDDVAPDVDVLLAVDVPVAVDVDPELVVVEPLSVDVGVEVPVLGVTAGELESVLVAELSCDVDDVLDVSALATPGEVTTITPIPKAAANAPTRPI